MRVVWAATARAEFLASLARIRTSNPSAARKVARQIDQAVEQLAVRNTGRHGRVPGTFEKSVTGLPYIVAFAIESADRVVVLRVIHTSRHWPRGAWPEP